MLEQLQLQDDVHAVVPLWVSVPTAMPYRYNYR